MIAPIRRFLSSIKHSFISDGPRQIAPLMAVASKSYPPPPKRNSKAPIQEPQKPEEFCDKCHIGNAKFEITTKSGPLFLCGHHYRMHSLRFLLHNYEIKEI